MVSLKIVSLGKLHGVSSKKRVYVNYNMFGNMNYKDFHHPGLWNLNRWNTITNELDWISKSGLNVNVEFRSGSEWVFEFSKVYNGIKVIF